MRVDWAALVDDVGWKLAHKKHGRWVAVSRAMNAAGVPCSTDAVRSWHGRGKTPGGDAAFWLLDAARGLGVTLRFRDQNPIRDEGAENVQRGTSGERCSQP